jgi:alkaline phosphatase
MVADGFGPVAVTLARECLQVSTKRRLTLDSILTGTASTYSANSLVTDSAAAATALACGIKTYNYNVGVGVDGKPCGTLLEAAKVKGMQTAVVVTSEITHATPASFTAHVLSRESVDTIGDQQMDQNITLILGGGLAIFNSTSRNSMLAKARSKHYTLVLSKEELTRGNNLSLPLIGLFASSHLAYEIDRNRTSQPSLAEMTNAALQLLSREGSKGFFLLVEGSRIDHAGHVNDPGTEFREVVAFDEAVTVAVDFAAQHPSTLVVVTADHETGGMTLGRDNIYAWDPLVVVNQRRSIEATVSLIAEQSLNINDAVAVIQDSLGFVLSETEHSLVRTALMNQTELPKLLSGLVSQRANIGWTTFGHSGVDVNVYAYGSGAEEFRGHLDNTEISKKIARLMEFDLGEVTNRLQSELNDERKSIQRPHKETYVDVYHKMRVTV